MEKVKGKSVVKKTTFGKAFFIRRWEACTDDTTEHVPSKEIIRLEKSIDKSKTQLNLLYEKARNEIDEKDAMIFEVHLMMLDDEEFCGKIVDAINEMKCSAEEGVNQAVADTTKVFLSMENEYFRERAADIQDIGRRVVMNLMGKDDVVLLEEPSIIVAEELSPSQTIQLDRDKILGFVTKNDSTNSHTAILARSMNVPAIFGVDVKEEWDSKILILYGTKEEVVIEPTEEQLSSAKAHMEDEIALQEKALQLIGKPTETLSGVKVELCANIGSAEDVDSAIENDAEGIGLFRSEFIYLKSKTFPTEEEQFITYKTVAEKMKGKRVIIRTLDIGADKKVDYFGLDDEANPALGFRAIRMCLERQEIFRTQLRAILRASFYGKIAVMLPMITSAWEIEKCRRVLEL